jgi:V/A-type H+-transporting ATPase subunit A
MEALSNEEKLKLEIARSIREDFLFQNAFDPDDAFTSLERQYGILKSIITVFEEGLPVVRQDEFDFRDLREQSVIKELPTLKSIQTADEFSNYQSRIRESMKGLMVAIAD